jgi:hypothetical protein
MDIKAVFDKVKLGFAPHILELEDWKNTQYIILDGEVIGILTEKYKDNGYISENKGKAVSSNIQRIYYEPKKKSTAYERKIGKNIFDLAVKHISKEREKKKKQEEKKRLKEMQVFRHEVIKKMEELRNEGIVNYDRIIESKSTASVYLYKGKKRILRISTHPSYLKNCKDISLIIPKEETDRIDINIEIFFNGLTG